MTKAVFLDRDGTLNKIVFDKQTEECRPPWKFDEIEFYPLVFESLKTLQDNGFDLFIVTNQPDYAKGKTDMVSLLSVRQFILHMLIREGITLREYYWCAHSSFQQCQCRKPKPYFLFEAQKNHNIDLQQSWMIGDSDIDIECGQSAGVHTIMIDEPTSIHRRGNSKPEHTVRDLKEVVEIITRKSL